jgi:RNA polymerase sigma factor (sigma-70 family)
MSFEKDSNEELAMRIKAGENELMLQLWMQVEHYIHWRAGRFIQNAKRLGNNLNGCDFEDLYQAGYLAVDKAVCSFSGDPEHKFITILSYTVKSAFAEALNIRTERAINDALNKALSLDASLYDNDGNFHDFIIDTRTLGENSVEEIAMAELYQQQLQKALDESLAMLPEKDSTILRQRYFLGLKTAQIAELYGCSSPSNITWIEHNALRKLYEMRKMNGLEEYYSETQNLYRGSGVKHFKQSLTSSVEQAVIEREALAFNWLKEKGLLQE